LWSEKVLILLVELTRIERATSWMPSRPLGQPDFLAQKASSFQVFIRLARLNITQAVIGWSRGILAIRRRTFIVSFRKSTLHPLLLSGTSATGVTSAGWSWRKSKAISVATYIKQFGTKASNRTVKKDVGAIRQLFD
jgi:hypothetical protein